MRVLLLVPDLEYGGAAGQLVTVAPRLAAHDIEARAVALDGEAPWFGRLRDGRVAIDLLGWHRLIDLDPFLRLRRLVRQFRPDVVHAWGIPAVRAAALVWPLGSVVVSEPLSRLDWRHVSWLDAWLLRRAGRVVAAGAAEEHRLRQLRVAAECLAVVPPAAADADADPSTAAAVVELPPRARVILCVGPLGRRKGHRDAIWAFDILKYLYDDLHLVLVGAGPERETLAEFARAIGASGRVHFAGPQASLAGWLSRADLVWVPSLAPCGRGAALDGMAAGRCVVASRVPGPADVVADGETGILVPPGDKAALARQTRVLLDDDDLRRRLGDAARRSARSNFTPEAAAARFAAVYRSLLP